MQQTLVREQFEKHCVTFAGPADISLPALHFGIFVLSACEQRRGSTQRDVQSTSMLGHNVTFSRITLPYNSSNKRPFKQTPFWKSMRNKMITFLRC